MRSTLIVSVIPIVRIKKTRHLLVNPFIPGAEQLQRRLDAKSPVAGAAPAIDLG
jgi:hypothetical protein